MILFCPLLFSCMCCMCVGCVMYAVCVFMCLGVSVCVWCGFMHVCMLLHVCGDKKLSTNISLSFSPLRQKFSAVSLHEFKSHQFSFSSSSVHPRDTLPLPQGLPGAYQAGLAIMWHLRIQTLIIELL